MSNIVDLVGFKKNKNQILEAVKTQIEEKIKDANLDFKIKDLDLYDYKEKRSSANETLKVAIEYDGTEAEYEMYNIIAREEIEVDNINIDINPINKYKSGPLKKYLYEIDQCNKEYETEKLLSTTIEEDVNNLKMAIKKYEEAVGINNSVAVKFKEIIIYRIEFEERNRKGILESIKKLIDACNRTKHELVINTVMLKEDDIKKIREFGFEGSSFLLKKIPDSLFFSKEKKIVLLKKIISEFGFTNDEKGIGFISPNGEKINFKYPENHNGFRDFDHRYVLKIFQKKFDKVLSPNMLDSCANYNPEYTWTQVSIYMYDLIKELGLVRVSPESSKCVSEYGFFITKPLTNSQKNTIRNIASHYDKIVIDLQDSCKYVENSYGLKEEHMESRTYSGVEKEYIFTDIENFFEHERLSHRGIIQSFHQTETMFEKNLSTNKFSTSISNLIEEAKKMELDNSSECIIKNKYIENSL